MSDTIFHQGQVFAFHECPECGVMHAFPERLNQTALQNRGPRGHSIYCPNGHGWHYTGETEEEKLRRERDRLKQNTAYLESQVEEERRRAAAYKGEITKMRKRAKAGICPCCSRHFTNLERHMASKHPEFEGDAPELHVVEGGRK